MKSCDCMMTTAWKKSSFIHSADLCSRVRGRVRAVIDKAMKLLSVRGYSRPTAWRNTAPYSALLRSYADFLLL